MNAEEGLLQGYRVLDLTDERGLMTGRILADLGADVVQVEPPDGSRARQATPISAAGSYVWDTYAANKRGIVADPATAEGSDLIRRLVQQADFFIESLGPGVAERYGLGCARLRELN
ncbi:MAG TPA: CoA transferase, partial [Jatrophihabitans sp.]|nr:CoA transferase [Jatrophihabitans sp.]